MTLNLDELEREARADLENRPCGCISSMEGVWQSECSCVHYYSLQAAAAWCASANSAETVLAMIAELRKAWAAYTSAAEAAHILHDRAESDERSVAQMRAVVEAAINLKTKWDAGQYGEDNPEFWGDLNALFGALAALPKEGRDG